MTPLNQPERKKAFFNFLIFFGITVGLIVAAVLFSVQVPFKQNDQLRAQLEIVEKERDFATTFTGILDTTISGLKDVVNPDKKNEANLTEGRVMNNINELQKMVDNDKTITNRNFYNKILLVLNDLSVAQKDSRRVSELETLLKEYKDQQRVGGYMPQQQPMYPTQQ